MNDPRPPSETENAENPRLPARVFGQAVDAGLTPAPPALPPKPTLLEELRPWTGSVLCRYDPSRVETERIVAAFRRATGVAIVRRPGEPAPELDAGVRRVAGVRASRFSHAMRESFRGINRSVMRQTEGHLDLGALAALGFLALGAAEIAGSRTLPAPPW